MTDTSPELLKVIGDVIRDRLHKMEKRIREAAVINVADQLPAPVINLPALESHVTNEVGVPTVNVTVDMTPVADALDRLAQVLAGRDELLSQLLQVLAEQEPPQFSPRISLPEIPVNVVSKNTVEAPAWPERKPRKLELVHEDGSKTIVREIA